MMETEIRAPWDCDTERETGGSWAKFSLLRELGKRMRAEEAAAASKGGAETDAPPAEEGGKKSTYELMKELEQRLREETETETQNNDPATCREGEPGERRGWRVRAGGRASNYDEYVRGWKEEMRAKRSWLEELWKSREETPATEKTDGVGEKAGLAEVVTEEISSSREGEEKEVEDETINAGRAFPQSDRTVVYLKNEANGAEIFLVGTSHVSQKSVAEVKEVSRCWLPSWRLLSVTRNTKYSSELCY